MAFYQFNQGTAMGVVLRSGLNGLRTALDSLRRVNASFAQMTDAQIVDAILLQPVAGGNTAVQQAAALKAELASDVGKLLTDASQTNVNAALNQLLAQTG